MGNVERLPAYSEYPTNGDDGGVAVTLNEGRINVNIDGTSKRFTEVVEPLLHSITKEARPPQVGSLGRPDTSKSIPRLNIVMHIVGSRGDVQPFVALGRALKLYGHRIRIATHPTFQKFVEENELEFFSIGGDPKELMQFMVNNPNLIPSLETLRSGEIARRQKGMAETIQGCWRSCYETGNGIESQPGDFPFVADAIIANPPSFAHIHCAERLGIPLHIVFTMPWSPTQAFPHPLANIQSSNADPKLTNLISYIVVDLLTWQGLGPLINKFRKRSLALEPVDPIYAIGLLWRQRIPHSYCWSPALIPKPSDWADYIKLTSFHFLPLAASYRPPTDLREFLANGPPPVYIGFGSIVVDDPDALTSIIFRAVIATGIRAIVSKGWGGLGALEVPEQIYMIGNCPHDWLFPQVSAVVHHGGAGTVSAGIAAGKPTVVVPFFGDQPFWGEMIARAGAGPRPIPFKKLDEFILAKAIMAALEPKVRDKAEVMAKTISNEDGPKSGIESFHSGLPLDKMRCSLLPDRFAAFRLKGTQLLLCPLAAAILLKEDRIEKKRLRLHRCADYALHHGAYDIISGSAVLTFGWATEVVKGMTDISRSMVPSRESLALVTSRRPSESSSIRSGWAKKSSGTVTPLGSKPKIPRRPSTAASSEYEDALESPESISPSITNESTTTTSGQDNDSATDPGTLSSETSAVSEPDERPASSPTSKKPSRAQKGAVRIVSSTARLPSELLNTLAQGMHNMPQLYGDKTVRPQDRITGYQSGFAAGGKELGLGLWDGITGLVTQPVKGGMTEGAAGAAKGAGRGVLGAVIKPFAGLASFLAFPLKGIEKEIDRASHIYTHDLVFSSRLDQGTHEMQNSTSQEWATVSDRFYYSQEAGRKKRKPKVIKEKKERKPKNGE
ncbi:MAG: hypothetical protein M1814_000309 [Vezdaea aestivalis]|nr:MAG: hypothetical protein M1814_000309 [Vezdaea aestivalis]